MRRIRISPKPAKRSRIPSPSTLFGGLERVGLCRGDRDRFAAAAGRGLVRVLEHELRRELRRLVVHLGAEQEQHRLRIDEDLDALVLDDVLAGLRAFRVLHRVGHAGAAAVLDADAHAGDRPLGLLDDLLDAVRGGVRERQDLEAGQGHHSLRRPGSRPGQKHLAWKIRIGSRFVEGAYHMSSATRASSDMRLWSQGGSKTMLTVTALTPGTEATAFSTHTGISPATGQPGAVSVMSTATFLSSSTST